MTTTFHRRPLRTLVFASYQGDDLRIFSQGPGGSRELTSADAAANVRFTISAIVCDS